MGIVVVGVDETDQAQEAVRVAAREASLRGATLRIVNVWHNPPSVGAGLVGIPRDVNPQPIEGNAAEIITAAATIARQEAGPIEIDEAPMAGDPAHVLCEASSDADLLVVGSRGRGDLASLVLGSVSHACVRQATCPVIIVHSAGDPDGPVVVGADSTPAGTAAVDFAAREAAARKVELRVVHAWRVPVAVALGPMAAAAPLDPEPLLKLAHSVHQAAIEAATAIAPGLVASSGPVEGDPVSSILAAAEGASLIVVGTRREGDLTALLVGSVGHAVLHEASVPVAFVAAAS